MPSIYFFSLFLFILSFAMRWHLARQYTVPHLEKTIIDEKKYTIIQPILSGDPRLETDLRGNLEQTQKMAFMWLVDKSDQTAQKTIELILQNPEYANRVQVFLLDDVPQEVNPKIYKLKQVIPKVTTDFFIVLDDDSVIDFSRFNEMNSYETLSNDFIVTGIPTNYGQSGFYSKMIAAFVNSNAILTYFPMAKLQASKTINGMFYISRTELFQRYNVFEAIQYELCDDLAVADFLLHKNVTIIQSHIPCNVRNTVLYPINYLLLMKRWLLFASIYIKKHPSLALCFIVVLPSIFPGVLLLLSLVLGLPFFLGTITVFGIKAFLLSRFREQLFAKKDSVAIIGYELLNDLILPFLFVYTLLTPPVITWRNKKIHVTDGKINYV